MSDVPAAGGPAATALVQAEAMAEAAPGHSAPEAELKEQQDATFSRGHRDCMAAGGLAVPLRASILPLGPPIEEGNKVTWPGPASIAQLLHVP